MSVQARAARSERLPAPCSMATGPVARRISPWPSAAAFLVRTGWSLAAHRRRFGALHGRNASIQSGSGHSSSSIMATKPALPSCSASFDQGVAHLGDAALLGAITARQRPAIARRQPLAQIQAFMILARHCRRPAPRSSQSVLSCASASSSRSRILGRRKVGMAMTTRSAMAAPASPAPAARHRIRITSSPSRCRRSEAMGPKVSSSARVASSDTALDLVPMPASSLNCAGGLQQHRGRRAQGAHRHDDGGERRHQDHIVAGHSLS